MKTLENGNIKYDIIWSGWIHREWISGIGDIEIRYRIGQFEDTLSCGFAVIPHFYKRSNKIKHYSVWYQDEDMMREGGDNFALKIAKCYSLGEGQRIAEDYYNTLLENKLPKSIGTQYIDDDTYFDICIVGHLKEL